MDKLTFRRKYVLGAYALCAFAVVALAACGGGGGGSTANSVVSSGNAAPTISGTPPTSDTAGQAYSFTPTASGPSGATLTFSIQNMPSWASFSASTGALTGTPSSSNVGTFSNIMISVSDGTQSASLAAFNIQVASSSSGSGTGSAALSWTVPTTNTDGTALTDLAGFTINYGTNSGSMNQTVTVASAGTTDYTVQGLASGTWYFSVRAYTSVGTESAPSDVVSKTIS